MQKLIGLSRSTFLEIVGARGCYLACAWNASSRGDLGGTYLTAWRRDPYSGYNKFDERRLGTHSDNEGLSIPTFGESFEKQAWQLVSFEEIGDVQVLRVRVKTTEFSFLPWAGKLMPYAYATGRTMDLDFHSAKGKHFIFVADTGVSMWNQKNQMLEISKVLPR